MSQKHIILALAWIFFCVIHSVMASVAVKQRIRKYFDAYIKWYRPVYVLIAAITFGTVIYYQLSIPSQLLYKTNSASAITGGIIGVTGVIIMVYCIIKYFSSISGLNSLLFKNSNNKLLTSGLHRYVRHPLYFGTFLFIWGMFIAFPNLSWLISSTIITIYTLIGIRFEEAKLVEEYGEPYKKYKRTVPMILPMRKNFKNSDFTD